MNEVLFFPSTGDGLAGTGMFIFRVGFPPRDGMSRQARDSTAGVLNIPPWPAIYIHD